MELEFIGGEQIMDLLIPMVMICGFFLLYFTLFLSYNRAFEKNS